MSEERSRLVSVILPVYNEAAVIERTVTSLLAQQLDPNTALEVLVIDGQSTDGSRALVEAMARRDCRIRLLENPNRTAPCAFNIGLRESRGAYVCILGAHCVYDGDYIAVCLREMLAHQAVGCSGRAITRPAGTSLAARLACWTLGHPFGVSRDSFRTQPEGYVDTIPYPVFRKSALLAVGGYDESLTRNQDNDMNYRLRRAGHTLYCTWRTTCEYRARPDLKGLLDYARANGFWCGISARTTPRSLGGRHYAPFAFLLATLAGVLLVPAAPRLPAPLVALAALPLGLHLLAGHLAAAGVALRVHDWRPVLLPWVFLAFHLTYGFAFARGLVSPLARQVTRQA